MEVVLKIKIHDEYFFLAYIKCSELDCNKDKSSIIDVVGVCFMSQFRWAESILPHAK